MIKKPYYCLWSNDGDKDIFFTENSKIKYCADMEELRAYCDEHNLQLEDDAEFCLDVDSLVHWLEGTDKAVDCNFIIDLWNSFQDFAFSVNKTFIGNDKVYNHTYDKLFHGLNLPAVNTSGRIYTPEWDDEELAEIREVMQYGVDIVFSEFEIRQDC